MKTSLSGFLKSIFFLLQFLIAEIGLTQTIIMNEVSNGPSGNKEYVEFVVVDTVVTYDCGASSPPCIDIRGWIFDDNSGYHGPAGIAAGAIRFSFDPLWSCVPLGTVILIYNDADINPSIPTPDLTLSDGNCRIVAPISNTSLFESNTTTPGSIACSYPSTGWTPGGNWSHTLLANPGDCARVVNLAGCEVFSVCWGSDSLNTIIYFNSGMSGTDNVWFFNDGDPNLQSNWSEGCADVSSCGVNQQTPGSANNAANAAFIAQFNNGCSPITVLSTTTITNDATCSCNGSATVNASGSIPTYAYEWYDNSYVSIGQTTATATGLCPGTYHAIVNSIIGCSDTATVIISSTGIIPFINVSPSDTTLCSGQTLTLNASGGISYSWSPVTGLSSVSGPSVIANPVSTTTYTVTGTNASGCSNVAVVNVNINPSPTVIVPTVSTCEGIPATLNASGADTYVWSPSTGLSSTIGSSVIANSTSTTTYTVIGTNSFGCSDTSTSILNVMTSPIVNVPPVLTLCNGDSIALNASGASSYIWSPSTGLSTTSGASVLAYPSTTLTYTVTGTNSFGCSATANSIVNVSSGFDLLIDPLNTYCISNGPIQLFANVPGGYWNSNCSSCIDSSGLFNPVTSGIVEVYYSMDSSCVNADTISIQVAQDIDPTILSNGFICGTTTVQDLTALNSGGTWSGVGIIDSINGIFNPALTGTGTFVVVYSIDSVCLSSDTLTIVVSDLNVNSTVNPTTCIYSLDGSVQLNATGSGTINYSVLSPIPLSNTTGNFSGLPMGNYVFYITDSAGCSDTLSLTINGPSSIVNSSFTMDPVSGQPPLLVNFTNTSTNATNYYWEFGNGDTSSLVNPTSVFNDQGTYTVLLIATDGVCYDTSFQTLSVLLPSELVIYNVFSPNNDGTNDVWIFNYKNITNFNCLIYNRWGVLIFETNTIENGWEGKDMSGMDVSDGTYFYIIKAEGLDGKVYNLNGDLSLFRNR